jgi:hypothetical protein
MLPCDAVTDRLQLTALQNPLKEATTVPPAPNPYGENVPPRRCGGKDDGEFNEKSHRGVFVSIEARRSGSAAQEWSCGVHGGMPSNAIDDAPATAFPWPFKVTMLP